MYSKINLKENDMANGCDGVEFHDMEYYIQTDKEAIEILTGLVNGTYPLESFRSDVMDALYQKDVEAGLTMYYPNTALRPSGFEFKLK